MFFCTNDVIMTSLKVTHFILALGTDHRVSRKRKLLSISDLFLVSPNNDIKTPKSCKFAVLLHHCDVIKHLLLLQFNFYTSMKSYIQKLWKRSCEEIQIRIKIA